MLKKLDIRQVFASNLEAAMERSISLSTQATLSSKAKMSQSHLSEILRGVSVPSIEVVNDLAFALGLQPWELLADGEATKQAALAKMLWGDSKSDREVEKHLPSAPPAPKPRTRRRRKPQQ